MTTGHLFAIVALGLALAAGACAPADPPTNPSFAKDVLPVMQAHCVRCHGGNGMLNGDAQSTSPVYKTPPENGYYDSYEDKVGCTPTANAACAGAKTEAPLIHTYLHLGNDLRMPPLPADPLSDWDIKLIDNWTAEKPSPAP